ncbi:hypothetical protein ARMGADRAFT_1093025 [Armillaria gallica]|uniref:Mid2 domain-containing protein n=1 Tax=Armillaria gallica TaxID=47427 RepID=A0A2H3CTU9_ARMGA|nr:hypothetical protein ARMGADRAFT_1093025 [Armillaria gallica]
MLLHFVLFCFCFATSTGFLFDGIKGSATVGAPFSLTWHLDQDDDPNKLVVERRNLQNQNSGQGNNIPFSFPNNGVLDGAMVVTFPLPGDYSIEVFNNSTKSLVATSDIIPVSSPGINPDSITASVSVSTSGPIPTATTSSVMPISSTSSSSGYGDSSTMSSFATAMSGSTTDGTSTTTSTPSSTPNNSNSHKTKQMSTITGAVIGVMISLLLLALGVLHYYRLHRSRSYMLSLSPTVMFEYLQIRPSSQHRAIHELRGRDVPVSASVNVLIPTSINSGIVEFEVEEGVPELNLPEKGTKLVTNGPRTSTIASDDNAPEPSLSGGLAGRKSLQILAEEPMSRASTSALQPLTRSDEMAEEITRLRTQIQQLITNGVSGWDPGRGIDPPPAYSKDM